MLLRCPWNLWGEHIFPSGTPRGKQRIQIQWALHLSGETHVCGCIMCVAVRWIILWRHYIVACKYEVESSLSTASSLKWQQMDVFGDGCLWDYLINCLGISRVISSDPSNLREGLLSPFYRWHSERISDLSKVKWLISGNATVQTFICWSAKSILSLSPYTDQTFLGW